MFSTPVNTANYNQVVSNGELCVNNIIEQMTDRYFLKSVKTVITYNGGSYVVNVYYLYGELW